VAAAARWKYLRRSQDKKNTCISFACVSLFPAPQILSRALRTDGRSAVCQRARFVACSVPKLGRKITKVKYLLICGFFKKSFLKIGET
jgi:hypothetical protein